MRKLILAMSMSLDGFVSSADGNNQWIFSGDQEAVAWKVEKLRGAGLIIMGSRSFQDMAPFWLTATIPFAPPMNQVPKAVFSKQGPAVLQPAIKALADTSPAQLQPGAESWGRAYVAGGDLAEEIGRLKAGDGSNAEDGKPIIALGGGGFACSLIAHNLVDEYALMIHPVVLGKGVPIFADLPAQRPLKLVDSKVFPLGAVALAYQPA